MRVSIKVGLVEVDVHGDRCSPCRSNKAGTRVGWRERGNRKKRKRGGFGLYTKSRETWREGNKGGEDGRLGVPSEHTPV